MQETSNNELDNLVEQDYVPSESERKKAVLMYFLIGIIIWINKQKNSTYESFHLKQALGWWSIFMLFLVFSVFLVFVPYLNLIPIILFILMLVVLVMFLKQAWDGVYITKKEKIFLPFFYWIWTWIHDLFDLVESDSEEESNK